MKRDDPAPALTRINVADPIDKERAEFAIIIREDAAGRGLGTLLMSRMISYASSCGIGEIVGDVLADNANMLAICRRPGFTLRNEPDSPGVTRVSKALAGALP